MNDYLKLLKAPPNLATVKDKVDWLWENAKNEIFKNRDGAFVIKESNLPTKAAYKYKEGSKSATYFTEVTEFEDVQDARDAFKEFKAEDSVTGEASRRGRSRSRSPPVPLPARRSPEKKTAPEIRKPLERHPTSCSSRHSSAGPEDRDGLQRQSTQFYSEGPIRSNASSVPARSRSRSPSVFSRRSSKAFATKSISAQGQDDGELDEKSKHLKKFRVSLVQLKTTQPAKLVHLSKELLTDAEAFDSESMFEGKCQKRDVQNLLGRLQTASNKLSGIVDDDFKEEAGLLADELVGVNDDITTRFEFFDEARLKPKELVLAAVKAQRLRMLTNIPQPLVGRVFTAIGSAAILKLNGSHTGEAVAQAIEFFNTSTHDKISVGCIPDEEEAQDSSRASVASGVQVNGIVNLIDYMFSNFSEPEFLAALAHTAVKNACPASVKMNLFGGCDRKSLLAATGWSRQCKTDFSLLYLMWKVLNRKTQKEPAKDIGFLKQLCLVHAQKQDISLRLRVFRGTRGKDKNLGRTAWEIIDKLAESSESVPEMEGKLTATFRHCHPEDLGRWELRRGHGCG